MDKVKKWFLEKIKNPIYPLIIAVIIEILKILFSPIDSKSIFYWLIEREILIIILGFWLIYGILKTTGEKVVKVLFNPCSPIVTLIVGWLLTLLVTTVQDESDINPFIQYLINHKTYLLIILACWFVITIMYISNEQALEDKDSKIAELEKEILDKENQINQSSGIILNKYGEFSRFNNKIRFHEVLELFVNNNGLVDSAQIYKYSSKYYGRNVKIKLVYEEGYAYDGIEINNMLQSYYTINRWFYDKFKEIVLLWKNCFNESNNYTDSQKECLESNLLYEISRLFDKVIKRLKKINSIDKIRNNDYEIYTLAMLLVRMLSDDKKITEFEDILVNKEVEYNLKSGKRTGVLGSILLEDSYIFKHERKNSKQGRFYLSFHMELYGQNYIVLFAISSNEMNESDDWSIISEDLKADFIRRLQRTGYNFE